MFDIEADLVVAAVGGRAGLAPAVIGLVGGGPLQLEDGQALAGGQRPGAGAGRPARKGRCERQARDGSTKDAISRYSS